MTRTTPTQPGLLGERFDGALTGRDTPPLFAPRALSDPDSTLSRQEREIRDRWLNDEAKQGTPTMFEEGRQ